MEHCLGLLGKHWLLGQVAMNITRRWKRIMAIGCTHGEFANPDALKAVLKFRDSFKPQHRVHLGDAYDTRALRSGAKGTKDESAPLGEDLKSGREFIRAYQPTVFCEGNHDMRPRALMGHHNVIIAEAAAAVHQRMMEPILQCKATFVEWSVFKAWEMGGYKFWHGTMFGENYLRDTANRWGNSVVAHAHRAGIAKGVRIDGATCYGVGTLADIESMEYAAHRAATLAWSHGMVWGEICEDRAHLQLHEWPRGEQEWRLPI